MWIVFFGIFFSQAAFADSKQIANLYLSDDLLQVYIRKEEFINTLLGVNNVEIPDLERAFKYTRQEFIRTVKLRQRDVKSLRQHHLEKVERLKLALSLEMEVSEQLVRRLMGESQSKSIGRQCKERQQVTKHLYNPINYDSMINRTANALAGRKGYKFYKKRISLYAAKFMIKHEILEGIKSEVYAEMSLSELKDLYKLDIDVALSKVLRELQNIGQSLWYDHEYELKKERQKALAMDLAEHLFDDEFLDFYVQRENEIRLLSYLDEVTLGKKYMHYDYSRKQLGIALRQNFSLQKLESLLAADLKDCIRMIFELDITNYAEQSKLVAFAKDYRRLPKIDLQKVKASKSKHIAELLKYRKDKTRLYLPEYKVGLYRWHKGGYFSKIALRKDMQKISERICINSYNGLKDSVLRGLVKFYRDANRRELIKILYSKAKTVWAVPFDVPKMLRFRNFVLKSDKEIVEG